jgi:hypothetical protein
MLYVESRDVPGYLIVLADNQKAKNRIFKVV